MAEEVTANPLDYEDINLHSDTGAINEVLYQSETDSEYSKRNEAVSPHYPRQTTNHEGDTVFSTDI